MCGVSDRAALCWRYLTCRTSWWKLINPLSTIELDGDGLPRETVRDPQGDARLRATRRRTIRFKVIGIHLDATTFVLAAIATSDRPAEFEPAKAIAIIPMARIEPRIAFVLSHLSNSRCSFGDIF